MKPVGQIYSLIVEDLKGFKYKKDYYQTKYKSLLNTLDETKAKNKITKLRFEEACDIIFSDVIRVADNRKNKCRTIDNWFKIGVPKPLSRKELAALGSVSRKR